LGKKRLDMGKKGLALGGKIPALDVKGGYYSQSIEN
jgi:hypothetical protein